MPVPRVSEMISPLSVAQIHAAISNAVEGGHGSGSTITVTWRELGDDTWTYWRGVVIGIVYTHGKHYATVHYGNEDPPQIMKLPNTDDEVEVGEVHFDPIATQSVAEVAMTLPSASEVPAQPMPPGLRRMDMRLQNMKQAIGMKNARETNRLAALEARVSALEARSLAGSPVASNASTASALPSTVPETPTSSTTSNTEYDRDDLGLECEGCTSFICIASSACKTKKTAILDGFSAATDQATQWMANHQLLFPKPAVCGHVAGEGSPCMNTTFTYFIAKRVPRWRCTERRCRYKHAACPPYWNPFAFCRFLFEYIATSSRLSDASKTIPDLSANSVRRFVEILANGAMVFNAEFVSKTDKAWKNVQWDETFVSQRKFQRGKRQRQGGILTFVGGVEVEQQLDGKTRIIEGIIAGVPSKERTQQVPLLLNATEPGATIATDAARMYSGLADAGRVHRVVNHRHTFVTEDGTTTNAVEGFWSCLKKKHRAMFGGSPGAAGNLVALRYQLICYLQNAVFIRVDAVSAAFVLGVYALQLYLQLDASSYDSLINACVGVFGAPSSADLDKFLDECALQGSTQIPCNQEQSRDPSSASLSFHSTPASPTAQRTEDEGPPRKLHYSEERTLPEDDDVPLCAS